jgi:hypothetical protein
MKHNSNTIATAQLRAVAYTRFSSTMQSDGNSIEAQLSAVRAYAKGEKVTLPRLRPPNNAKIKEESSNASKTNELSSTKGPKNMGHFGGESDRRTPALG